MTLNITDDFALDEVMGFIAYDTQIVTDSLGNSYIRYTDQIVSGTPELITAPVIAGIGYTGQTLTATAGVWTSGTATGQWHADGVAIAGEASLTYIVTSELDGSEFTYIETNGEETATSNSIHNWVPSDSETLRSWFDPTYDASITLTSGLVSSFTARVGEGSLVQATSGSRPSVVTRNGIQMLFSNNDNLKATGYAIDDSNQVLISALYEYDGTTMTALNESVVSMDGTADWQLISGATGTTYLGAIESTGIGGSTSQYASPTLDSTGNLMNISLVFGDGVRNGFNIGQQCLSDDVYTNNMVASELIWMGNRNENQRAHGYYGDLIIDDDVSASARQLIEGYQAWKYNTGLVAGHPYEFEAPVVLDAPELTSTLTLSGTVGQVFSRTLTQDGGDTVTSWQIVGGANSVDYEINDLGLLVRLLDPLVTGSEVIEVTASNAGGTSNTQTITINYTKGGVPATKFRRFPWQPYNKIGG